MSNEVYREEILTALTPPKQLHVREIADFTAGRDRVVTRKYVLLDEYERLRAALEKIATDEPLAACTVGCNEIAREALS